MKMIVKQNKVIKSPALNLQRKYHKFFLNLIQFIRPYNFLLLSEFASSYYSNMVSNKFINRFFIMSLHEFECQIMKVKIIKRNECPYNAISFKKYYVLRYQFSLTVILIFRCKYFSLKCSSISSGKQNTPISNKNSELSTSHLVKWCI